MSKPRVMYVCGHAPWPRNGGALLRNYWMISALSKRYAVDLVTASDVHDVPADFSAIIDNYAAFPRSKQARRGIGRLLRAALPQNTSLTAGWTSPAFCEYVAERLGRYPYVAIQADLSMFAALPRRNAIPIVYNAHNCESAFLSRRAKSEAGLIGPLLAHDALKVRAIERTLVNRAAFVAACTEDDVRDFERFVPAIRKKAVIVPNGVDIAQYTGVRDRSSDGRTVLITGSMDWRPNQAGLKWFLKGVLPILRAAMPDVRVRVAGRMTPEFVEELRAYPNIDPQPNPPSMLDALADATLVAAPIVVSSGTRLRILEAWAAGRPVITTTAGAFGLAHEDRRDIFIEDDPAEFAAGVLRLLGSPSLRSWIVANASRRVKTYDWSTIGEGLLLAYEAAVGGGEEPRKIRAFSEETVLAGRFS